MGASPLPVVENVTTVRRLELAEDAIAREERRSSWLAVVLLLVAFGVLLGLGLVSARHERSAQRRQAHREALGTVAVDHADNAQSDDVPAFDEVEPDPRGLAHNPTTDGRSTP